MAGLLAGLVLFGGCSEEPEFTWVEAKDKVGESIKVCGPIAGIRETEDATFLNIGEDYPSPDRFTFVVWHGDVGVPTDAHGNDAYGVCAKGKVTLFEGVAQIELDDADDLDFLLADYGEDEVDYGPGPY